MKIILAEIPETVNRDISIEKEILPKGSDIQIALYTPEKKSDFIEQIKDADAILTGYVPFDKELIDHLENCKVISIAATGYNYVDVKYAETKGIHCCAIGDYCTQEVADHTLMVLLALTRKLPVYQESINEKHEWNYLVAGSVPRLQGQTLGIVGLGKIGQAVAKRAKTFGMKLIAYDPYLPKEIADDIATELVDLEQILSKSDIITLHMNLTSENSSFFTYDVFKKMKKKPIIINMARGEMIDEADLLKALNEGLIKSAGLDVLESESPDLDNNSLVGRSDVILTPHVAFYSDTSMYLLSKIPADNIKYTLNGEFDKVDRFVNQVEK
ncbi:C-terminal binding protein [Aerococcus urinae]|uniref:C-terminal binding protein n=1 Tax=Aerococcus urinae TaxID=1376 RepID=UPI00254A84AE|nr:C-terminal binding protein [Aerococcus urinae]MDK7716377.1 C-terminal binding protein [Aerococcus urinae]